MDPDLSRVVDALPGLVWTALPDGQVDFFNRRWHEYTGIGFDEACGSGWQAAVHPEDLAELLERWQSILASGQPREMDARLRRVDGMYRRFLVRTSAWTDASGQIVKWCGINTDIDDRNRAEEALHARWWLWPPAREQHFRAIVDDLPALAVHVTPAGAVEHASRKVLEYFGATLAQMQDWSIADVVHPDDVPDALAAWRGGVATGRPYDVECRLRRADGAYRSFHGRPFPLRDTEGRIVLWYILLNDIDDRKRADALLASEKRLLEMVATGSSLPVVLDALCRRFEEIASDCTCSVVLVDAAGTHLMQGASPSLPPKFTESIDGRLVSIENGPCAMAASLNEQVISADIALETRWRSYGWCELALSFGLRACWSTPIVSRSGKVLGTFGLHYLEPATPTPLQQNLIEQFTYLASIAIERAQSDAALKRSEAFLLRAQQLSSTGSYAWLVATDDITWSEQLYRIYGFEQGTRITHALIANRFHPEDVPLLHEMLGQARSAGRDFAYEHRLLMPDQSIKHLHVVAHGAPDLDGRLVYIGAVQDVTERRRSEEAIGKVRSELAHMARVTSLGALTASIAHEVNQPLSGIVTNASTCLRMLAADPPNVEGARETARRTLRDGQRAADVIARLRALFAKKEAATESVDLNEAAREVIALSRSELQRSRVFPRAELADGLPAVTGDRVQLQQVILNLLLNASDAMNGVDDRPRHLVIRTECGEDDHVRLAVQDAGVGFEPQGADRLFEAFYTTKRGGMGIGLSVSRSIIESHRGRLWAAPNDGPGATFSFSLPREAEEARAAEHV